MKKRIECNKCNTRVSRFSLLRSLAGRSLYKCPVCGDICSFCVEKYARACPTCKYCGSPVEPE